MEIGEMDEAYPGSVQYLIEVGLSLIDLPHQATVSNPGWL